ncbi:MAG: apolipoprotein N-acyltransferase [bacterium]|nr:apolipoprotein N-acyltransferase [bacterium]
MGGANILAPILSGLLLAASFNPLNWWWLSYLALVPLLNRLFNTDSLGKALQIGAVFGLSFSLLFHGWLMAVSPWASSLGAFGLLVAVSLYFSLFSMLFCVGIVYLKDDIGPLILIPFLWVVCEYLRALGPFGNLGGAIGYTQAESGIILQLASMIGLWGLSAIVVFVNSLIFSLMRTPFRQLTRRFWLGTGIVSLVLLTGMVLAGTDTPQIGQLSVAVVQPNHAQTLKLDRTRRPQLFQDILTLVSGIQNVDVVLLPETITPSLNLRNNRFMTQLKQNASTAKHDIIFGTPAKSTHGLHNVITVMSESGLSKQHYEKQRLMPFGEYVPVRPFFMRFSFMKALFPYDDYAPGTPGILLHAGGAPFGAAICLEGIYADAYTNQVRNGAQYLVLGANNAWFGSSSAAAKLRQMARVRAVEQRRALLLSANTGLSAIIDAHGRLIKESALNHKTVLRADVPLVRTLSLYTQYPWAVIGVAFFFVGLGVLRRTMRVRGGMQ